MISPELADVLAAIIGPVRGDNGALGCVASYDPHERVWNPPMPLLFQRRFSLEHRAHPRRHAPGLDHPGAQRDRRHRPERSTTAVHPPRLPQVFITDAVLHGMPPHIAQTVAGHRDIDTTRGHLPRRGHRRAPRVHRPPPSPQVRNTGSRPTRNGTNSSATSNAARSPSAPAAVSTRPPVFTGTPADGAPLLRPHPAQRDRLVQVRDNLIARIAEARKHGWLGEVDGLQISLLGAREKLDQLDQLSTTATGVELGLPGFRHIAGRFTTAATNTG